MDTNINNIRSRWRTRISKLNRIWQQKLESKNEYNYENLTPDKNEEQK